MADMTTSINCVLMRGGTSRGPLFRSDWLPADPVARDRVLAQALGAGNALQLDGLGGGSTLTSKAAIVSLSSRPGCDVDYLFAQVGVNDTTVDTRPNCGNMLAAVAPFAIEQGMVPAAEGTTRVRVYNVNTGARIEAIVQTPGKRVCYDGNASIDGVPGTAAPILLEFMDAWGAITGSLFPTGKRVDVIDGISATCIDACMPLLIMRAADFGVLGTESSAELDKVPGLIAKISAIRLKAGAMMGLGDVSNSVVPKPTLISHNADPAKITSRYFTPHRCHTSHAVTGGIGLATAYALPGTIASEHAAVRAEGTHAIAICHPVGRIDVQVELAMREGEMAVISASVVRTARKIMEGALHLPQY